MKVGCPGVNLKPEGDDGYLLEDSGEPRSMVLKGAPPEDDAYVSGVTPE